MTVGIGAACKDGAVVIPDTLIVFPGQKYTSTDSKISGKIGHVIIAFSGGQNRFRLLEEILGIDVELAYLKQELKYSQINIIPSIAMWAKKLNQEAKDPIDLLIARHVPSDGNKVDLHYIDNDGNYQPVNYKAIGSGHYEADNDLSKLDPSRMTMAEFTVEALVSILRIERDCENLNVSIKNMKPEIRWFRNGAEWDVPPNNLDALLEEARRELEKRFPKRS